MQFEWIFDLIKDLKSATWEERLLFTIYGFFILFPILAVIFTVFRIFSS